MSLIASAIEPRLRERICPVCVWQLANGACGLPAERKCPIFANLDKLIDIVDSTHDDLIDVYVNRTRQHICANCVMGNPEHCVRRDELECALDLYLSLAIEVIEEQLQLGRTRPGGWRVRI